MKKRILVIEDEISIAELLTLVFTREGYEVSTCQNGREAIAMMKKIHPHLVILDIMLPGLDGSSILKIVSEDETLESTPIIITSALGEAERLFKPYPQVKAFASKPFVLTRLISLVKHFIGD